MMLKLIFIFDCLLLLVTSNPLQGLQLCPPNNYQQNYINSDQLARASSFDAFQQQLYYPNQWLSPQNIPNLYQDQSNKYYDNFLMSFVPNSPIDTNLPIYSQNGLDAMQYQPNLLESSPQSNNYVIVPENYLKDQRFDNRKNSYLTSVNGYMNENIWMPKDSNPAINYYDPSQLPYMGISGNQNIISTQPSDTGIPKRLKERNGNENESIKRKSSKKNHKRKNNTTKLCKNDEKVETKSRTHKSNKVTDLSLHTSQNDISDQKLKANKNTKNSKPNTRSRSKSNKMVGENIKAKDITVKDCALKQDIDECLDINEDCTSLENRRPRNNHKSNPVQTYQEQYPNMPQDFTNNIASYLNNFMPNQNFNANLFSGNGNFPYNFDHLYQMPQQSNVNTNENDKRRRNRRKKKKSKSNRESNTSQSSKGHKNIEENCKKVVELSTISAEKDTVTEPISNQAKNNEYGQQKIFENNKKHKSNRKSNNDQSSNKQQNIEENCKKVVELSTISAEIDTMTEPISNQAKNNEYGQQKIIENNINQKSNRKSNNDQSSNKQQNIEENCKNVVKLSTISVEIDDTMAEPISYQAKNNECEQEIIENNKKQKSNRKSNNDQSSNKQQNIEENCKKVVNLSTISAEIDDTMTEPISNQAINNKYKQEIIENNKKQKSNRKSNNDQSSSKQQNIKDHCVKVIDLSPKSLEIETVIEPISNQDRNNKNQKQVIEVETPEKFLDIISEQNSEIVLEPSSTLLQKHEPSAAVLEDEDIPNVYDNDIYDDDYYPDFTSDNIYLSKEDHDWNFHDRHYYTSDSNAEMSTERRRYEPNSGQSLQKHQFGTTEMVPKQNSGNIRDVKALTEEINFKTPPGLEFPDFKTEMINKNKYSPGADINFQPNTDNNYQNEKISSFSNVKSSGNKNTNNSENTVETVYANSKVVKYGGSEKISRKFSNVRKNNNVTNDDKTTIILAKSLDNSENYK